MQRAWSIFAVVSLFYYLLAGIMVLAALVCASMRPPGAARRDDTASLPLPTGPR